MKSIIFIAPPATGKGTQSEMLKRECNYHHISTGDLLRKEAASGSELGREIKGQIEKGILVQDKIITQLLVNALKPIGGKFVLDGYPRNTDQAEELSAILERLNHNDYIALYLRITKGLALKRALSRVVCESCGRIYNLLAETMKPRAEGVCDDCGDKVSRRSDDTEETFLYRFNTYISKTEPVLDYYQNKGKLEVVTVGEDKAATFVKVLKYAL